MKPQSSSASWLKLCYAQAKATLATNAFARLSVVRNKTGAAHPLAGSSALRPVHLREGTYQPWLVSRMTLSTASHVGDSMRQPPPQQIPDGAVKFKYVRSSGPGGQNVNKVSTACEARFLVADAEWLPPEVRLRLAELEKHRLTSEGELVVFAQEERTQARNRARCEERILDMVKEAWEPPKPRVIDESPTELDKARWRAEKRDRSKIKQLRQGKVRDDDY